METAFDFLETELRREMNSRSVSRDFLSWLGANVMMGFAIGVGVSLGMAIVG